jgi:hypothetical protein
VSPLAFAQQAPGTWEPVSSAIITQGDRVYDRRSPYGRAYYTDNQISIGSVVGTDEFRLVVKNNSHLVANADGSTDGGESYFNHDGTNQGIRIYFSLTRAAFSYDLEVQQWLVEESDLDGDGIVDSQDICPADPDNDADNDGICGDVDVCPADPLNDADGDNICDSQDICLGDPTNMCIVVSGFILGNGSALDSASVKIGLNSVSTQSDGAGEFSANAGPLEMANDRTGRFFPVAVTMPDFSSGNAKVRYVAGQLSYSVTVNLQQVSDRIDEDDDVTQGVMLLKDGATVGSLTIPSSSLPQGVTGVNGAITYLDPESDDMLSMPGDLLALPVGANPNDAPVALETFGMMEFDLKDQNGNPVTALAGSAEVCMRAPAGLSFGDTVPLWYYDEAQGLWIEEGQGTVEDRDAMLQICGDVSHFSWWNYDQPIITHSCFSYKVVDELTSQPIVGLTWYAEGATYNGSSPSRSCASGNDNFDSFTVKISQSGSTESIKVFSYISGTKFYLMSDGDGTYSLSTSLSTSFNTPTTNGSCLIGTLSGACLLLDYQDSSPDGILPVDINNINLPPVITEFVVGDYLMLPGEQMQISATVTDPESDNVSLNWTSACGFNGASSDGSYTNPLQSGLSGTNFVNDFNSPDSLNYPVAYCELTLTATDDEGAQSSANRWITVASSFEYQVQGVLYGTDGLPLAGTEINYQNFTCNNLSQSVLTGPDGGYQLDINFAECGAFSEFGNIFYDLGSLHIQFEYAGTQWWIQNYIDDVYYGEFGQDLGCSVLPDGVTTCDEDIHLPVLWGPVSGDIVNSPFTNGFSLEYYGYNYYELYMSAIDIPQSATNYGPIMLPIGQGQFYLQALDAQISRFYEVNLLNQAGLTVDLGDGIVPVTVTLFDDVGVPLPGITINGVSGNGISLNHSQVTDTDGSVTFNSSLGYLSVYSVNPYHYFDGFAYSINTPILIDLNSTGLCNIQGTVYDEFGLPLPGLALQWWSGTGGNGQVTTDNNGQFTFSTPATDVNIYPFEDNLAGSYFYIDNCRAVNSSPRTIILDIPSGQFGFGGGLN